MEQENNYKLLIKKLDEFIRKFYLNKLIRGSIYFTAVLLSLYLLFISAEYYFYLPSVVRTIIFFGFAFIGIACLFYWIINPSLAYARLSRGMDHASASAIIGEHFPEVRDQLLNTLQLKEMADKNPERRALIVAGIDQKIRKLQPVPFVRAVNFQENKKILKYALAPLSVFILLLFTAPSVLKDGTFRVFHYQQAFTKPAPFSFDLLNDTLKAVQNSDFTLRLKVTGKTIPGEVYLVDENEHRYKLEKTGNLLFEHTLRNLQHSKELRFTAAGYSSGTYSLEVVPQPSLLYFSTRLRYPSYLNRAAETLENTGELTVPEGTRVDWDIHTENTEIMVFSTGQTRDSVQHSGRDHFRFSKRVLKSSPYALIPLNRHIERPDSVTYYIRVIPDAYPGIKVESRPDSVNRFRLYFMGEIRDDHGFTQLTFNYATGDSEEYQRRPVHIEQGETNQQFLYNIDIQDITKEKGEDFRWYFEIADNDGVNGPKTTKTAVQRFYLPTGEEIAKEIGEDQSKIKEKLSQASGKARQLQKEARELNEMLLQKKKLDFNEKNQIKQLAEKQKELEKFIQNIKEENEKNNLRESELQPEKNQQILEKQRQIQELFDKVLDEETKEMIRELEKLLEENMQNLSREEIDNLRMDNRSLEKELDRILELYKQLEFDKKLEQNRQRLEELAERQEEIRQEENPSGKEQEQEKLNQDFGQLREELKNLKEKNEALENKRNFEDTAQEEEEIQDELDKSLDELRKNPENPENAGKHQENAAGAMKKLSKKMQQMQQEMAGMELNVNIQSLRQILTNLLRVSFDQEELLKNMRETSPNDPRFLELAHEQRTLKTHAELVRDSIYSLSKKIPQIGSFVNKETEKINKSLAKVLKNLSDRNLNETFAEQQFVMTSVNNLALMLDEVLENLQEQMSSGKSGSGKPKPGLAQMSEMQKKLNERLQQMKEGLKPGEPVPGGQSEQLARMAKEQERIRKSLQELNRELNKDGQGKLGNLEKLSEEMEKTETDLYNKRITRQMIQRQKEIETRLLDAEKAEREQDTEEKREAKQGEQFAPDFSKILEEFKKRQQKQLEMIHTVPPEIKPFYKEKVTDYFNRIRD